MNVKIFLSMVCLGFFSLPCEVKGEEVKGNLKWLQKKRQEPKKPWGAKIVNEYAPTQFVINRAFSGSGDSTHEEMLNWGANFIKEKPAEMFVRKDASGRYEITAKGKNGTNKPLRILKCFVPDFHLDCDLSRGTGLVAHLKNGTEYYRHYEASIHMDPESPGDHYTIWDDVPFSPSESWQMPSGYEWEVKFWLDEALPQLWLPCHSDTFCVYRKADIKKVNPKVFLKPPKGIKEVYLEFGGDWSSGKIYHLDFTKMK